MPHRGKKVRRRKPMKKKIRESTFVTAAKCPLNRLAVLGPKSSNVRKGDVKAKEIAKPVKKEAEEQPPTSDGLLESRFLRKDGRVIIRNLPFVVTEDNLRKHLESYGKIEEVNILRRPDGKLVGCGFVQFSSKKSAKKAIDECNSKEFLGRVIILDWAVPKEVFKKNYKALKREDTADATEEDDTMQHSLKGKINTEQPNEITAKLVEDDHISDAKESYDKSEQLESALSGKMNRRRTASNDVQEGCTVFLKNVSFQTTSEELKEFIQKFGSVNYALICTDPLTEHSKGTAFVKFKNKESADACLIADAEELTLDCSAMIAVPAVSREEARQKINEGKLKIPRDGRNLYLLKEGVITAGSKAANGVSVSDMAQRVKLDQWKTQMLRSLKMFVSRYRLAVHNLPPEFSDHQMRELFQRCAGPQAVIKEARVMRDLKHVDSEGVGRSKGYGFVSFTKHEYALKALRNINNNPDIFTPDKRPIVAFSIENKLIINAKQKRLLKSQAMNPLYQNSKRKDVIFEGKGGLRFKSANEGVNSKEDVQKFSGLVGSPGVDKLRSRHKLQSQLRTHVENVKKIKHKKKSLIQQPKIRKVPDAKSQASQEKMLKRKFDSSDVAFTSLVKKYKTQLTTNSQKWYE